MTGLAEITPLGHFIHGAVMVANFAIAVFFLKHHSRVKDQLLLKFGIAFGLLGFERIILILVPRETEAQASIFLIRLCAFLLIIYAIIAKNRRGS